MIGRASRKLVVVMVALATVLLVGSTGPTVTAQVAPPQPGAPYRLGYVSNDTAGGTPGETSDIWSADGAGQDRRDLTNRPSFDEIDPAYSPDGTRLAYTEKRDGTDRVMVANADGSNARSLTAVTLFAAERDPAWSPDGTMIALTHVQPGVEGVTTSSVRIVRVSDGTVLGEVPMPAGLEGNDTQPAWSPDGRQIAFVRKASRVLKPEPEPPPPSSVTPALVDRPALAATSFPVDKVVRTPAVPAEPDIVLLIDGTGSMGSVIQNVRDNLKSVVERVRAQQPLAHFSVAVFRDAYDGADRMFRVELQPSPVDTDAQIQQLVDALGRVDANGGYLEEEDWINALFQIGTNAINFRPNSSKVVVLVGDAASHDPSPLAEFGFPQYSLQDAIGALNGQRIRVVAVPVGAANRLDSAGQATAVARATNGVVTPYESDPANVADAIVAGIGRLPVAISPVTKCDPGLSVTLNPPELAVPGGEDAKFAETVAVAGDAPVGATLRCTVGFRLNGETSVRPGYTEEIAIRVGLPVVNVDDVTAYATDADGAVIPYTASATDVTGAPLVPVCTPPPGRFRVGATTVTCTARSLATGAVVTDTATMTVVVLERISTERIWLVPVDQLTQLTEQSDLSVKFGEPCAGGRDRTPDWSPDGSSLVFEHAGTICVAGGDGANARQVIQDERAFYDPVFSPDGTLIAVADDPVEAPSGIWTVPATGGVPASLIATPGGAGQPAFQRVPDLSVTGTATPDSIAFGRLTTMEFTVANRGSTSTPDAVLTAVLPSGLRLQGIQTTKGACATATLRCSLGAMAQGETAVVQIMATGIEPGNQVTRASVRTGRQEANPQNNEVAVTVTVGPRPEPPPPPPPPTPPAPRPGSLAVTTTVTPSPTAYVGGDDLVVSYIVANGAAVPMPAVGLTITRPGTLPAPKAVVPAGCGATSCDLGELQPGQSVEVRLTFAVTTAVNGTVSATVTTTGPDSDPADNTANATVDVRQPVLQVNPTIGSPGFVARAIGRDLPPGAVIRLTWSVGISETPGQVVVRPDGTIEAQVLIFHKDLLGSRTLAATSVAGPRFGTVSSQPFLVIPRSVQPPAFVLRG